MLEDGFGLGEAFLIRRELCNFKKVCLNIFQEGKVVEKDLRQLAAFFFVDQLAFAEDSVEYERYSHLCDRLMVLRGTLEAVFDFRNTTKAICAMPRHPGYHPWPDKLVALPAHLTLTKVAHAVRLGVPRWLGGGPVCSSVSRRNELPRLLILLPVPPTDRLSCLPVGRPAGSAEAQAKVADCRPTLLLADRATLGLARG